MADRIGGKQEDQSDANSAGEARGDISLDQARILASQHARGNREFYGRYAEQDLSWDVISADETDDYYEIRLSYRPKGNFRTAGLEQFNIDKTGAIETRQIIRQPRLTPGFVAASIAIGLVAVTGAIFGGLSATGTQDTANAITNASGVAPTPLATTVSITPETLARLVSPDGGVTIDLDAKTVEVPTQLAYVSLSVAEIPALPAKFTATGKVFELTTETPLLKPITITVTISTADAALAAGNENNIVIQHHKGGAWTQLATEVDFYASTAKAKVDSLSLFALTVWEPDPTPAPTPAQAALPTAPPEPTLATAIRSPNVAAPTVAPAPLPTPAAISRPVPTPVPVPTAQPAPLSTPTPVPTATPAPAQEWLLENVLVAGDKVTVLVRILGPSWFNITIDGNATGETILDGSLRADVFRNVPPGSHLVRVFTVGVPGQEDFRSLEVIPPTATPGPTPTPSGPPTATPVPRYRLFINGVVAPALNSLLQAGAGTVTLSQGPKSDGAYKVGTEVVLAAGSPPGFVIAWGGVDSQSGVFATVEMVADRHVTVRMVAPNQTSQPGSTPFPWEIPTATPTRTPVPLPTPLPVPTATGVFISASAPTPTPTAIPAPTATPVPAATPTPFPSGTPTPTPTPAPTPPLTPSPTSGPTYALTTSVSPSAGGTVSPSGTNSYTSGTRVTVTRSASSGYIFSSWSGACLGNGSCVVTMDGNKTVTADFTKIFTLVSTASPAPGGTVVPDGSISYAAGTQIPVTASPSAGYAFINWTGDCTGSGSCVVTLDSDKTVTAVFVLLPTPTPKPPVTPSPSPSAGKIVFSSTRDRADQEIYSMNSDGSNVVRLTTNDFGNLYPEWSPDGSKIAWTSIRGNWDVYVMNSDGSGEIRLTTDDKQDRQPTWSPDGSKIAFLSTRDMDQEAINEIYVMNADGSNQTRLTNVTDICVNSGNCGIWEPEWSLDGSRIAFQSSYEGNSEIYVVNSDGTALTRLTNNPAGDSSPTWSPGSSQIAFTSTRDGGQEVYVMNSDGSSQTRISDGSGAGYSRLSWSPDGLNIAFMANRDGDWEIYTMSADGTSQINVSSNSAWDGQLDWGP